MNDSIGHQSESRALTWFRWIITFAWAAAIFNFSTETFRSNFSAALLTDFLRLLHVRISPETFATLHFLFRKSAHVTEYAVFSILLYHSFLNSNRTEWRPRAAVLSVLAAALYSLTDEFHQLFVPGRTGSLVDCGIDSAGALLGVLLIFAWARTFRLSPMSVEESS